MKQKPQNNEAMQYAMLGEDTQGLEDRLEKYTGEVDWPYLKKHYQSGALIYVDPALNITEVGRAIAEDDTETIKTWKKSGDIIQPSAPHAAYWEESGDTFLALVVSPFVLMQQVAEK